MNTTARKERHYFEMFRQDFPLPSGVVEYGDKPDVIVRGDRVTGIEITNFFLEPGGSLKSEQRQRVKRNAVILEAQRIFQKTTGRNVEFTFQFDTDNPIKDEKALAEKMASLAKELSQRKTGPISKELFEKIPELSNVYLNAKEYEDAKWRLAQVFSVPVMSRESLKKIIAEKESKSQFYRKCDAYWLLVIVDFMDRAQDQEVSIDGLKGLTSKVFEKVLVYKTVFGTVVETGAPLTV